MIHVLSTRRLRMELLDTPHSTQGVERAVAACRALANDGAQPCLLRRRQREEVFYGNEERNALTLHFESSEQTRLFGSPAFIYFPTAAWQDYYWSKVNELTHFLPLSASLPLHCCRMARLLVVQGIQSHHLLLSFVVASSLLPVLMRQSTHH